MTKQEFLSMNDHSLLKPHLTKKEIMEGLQYAKDTIVHLFVSILAI